MSRDIDRRLKSLNARRRGTDRVDMMSLDSAVEVIAKSFTEEAYSKRAAARRHTKYALGAMQAVDPDYTRIGIEEATRVGKQLESGLSTQGIHVEFRLQGSVPCDIHIRGASDVDLLVIEGRFFRYDTQGTKAQQGQYQNPVSYNTLEALQQLRNHSEKILKSAFPAATVNIDGAKAINVAGGSLRRPVDVVPSNWFDTPDFQISGAETDRGVEILDKSVPERLLNMPFKHIDRVNRRDAECLGGLKKAIRLCKNVKADAKEEGTNINLSSFDITSMLWHSDLGALTVGYTHELSILAEVTRFLDFLYRNKEYAKTLKVPDGSRAIFDSDVKLEALTILSLEMDDLAEKVSREQMPVIDNAKLPLTQIASVLRKAYISA